MSMKVGYFDILTDRVVTLVKGQAVSPGQKSFMQKHKNKDLVSSFFFLWNLLKSHANMVEMLIRDHCERS